MASLYDPDLALLSQPFDPADIEWRVQQAGEKNGKPWARVLAYVTNRAIQERLDTVVGPGNWKNDYVAGPAGGVACLLSVRVALPDGGTEWVTKVDGAENSDVEPVKGGFSNAMKRAAVQWGIGRYLYDLDEGWAHVHEGGKFSGKTKDGTWYKWDPPELPEWARPKPPMVASATLRMLETLLEGVADPKLAATIRRRLAAGMTQAAALDAVRFLEARQPAATA